MKGLIKLVLVIAVCSAFGKKTEPKKVLSTHTKAPVPTSPLQDTIKVETVKTVVETVTVRDTVKEDIVGQYKMFITEFNSKKITIELIKK